MEQTPSLPGHSPELPAVSPPSNGEMGGAFSNPETGVGGIERQEQLVQAVRAEQTAVPPVILPIPALPVSDDVSASAVGQPAVSTPAVANDDDLIEKEWVDKAKKVLAETKDDPYRREQEVGRLQADYLAKRYGRKLGSSQ